MTGRSLRQSTSAARAGPGRPSGNGSPRTRRRYPGVVERLRQARPQGQLIVDQPSSWPQDNEDAEIALRSGSRRAGRPASRRCSHRREAARGRARRASRVGLGSAWAGAAGRCARASRRACRRRPRGSSAAMTPAEIAEAYAADGWRADDALAARHGGGRGDARPTSRRGCRRGAVSPMGGCLREAVPGIRRGTRDGGVRTGARDAELRANACSSPMGCGSTSALASQQAPSRAWR